MTFAAPGFLAVLALAPLVVYLHMRRHRLQRVPSVGLWRQVVERAEPRPRLQPVRSSLSLWLQLVVVALAALALAEPRLSASAPTHHVLLLDAGIAGAARVGSGSETAYDAAWRSWLATVPAANGRDTYSVWWVGPWTRPLALELTSTDAVRRALEASGYADAPADWASAREALAGHDLERARVTVASPDADAAATALAGLEVGELRLASLPTPAGEVVLTAVSVELTDARAQRWTVTAAAQAVGDVTGSGVTFRVAFLPDGATTPLPYVERTVAFNLSGVARFSQEVAFLGAGVVQVSAYAEPPAGPAGTAAFHLDPAPARRTAVVVTTLGAGSPSGRALTATGRFDVTVADTLPPDADPDLVVVERAADPFDGRKRPAVLWLGSAPGATSPLEGDGRTALVVRWDREHPAANGTDWAQTSGARAAALPAVGETLVEGADGPLLAALTTRTGRELIAAYDPTDPRFVESDGFVTFIVDALDWLAPRSPQLSACTVGQPCRLPWRVVANGFEASLDDVPTWRQPPPAGAVVPSRLDESWRPTRAGLWRVTGGDGEALVVPVNPVLGATSASARAEVPPPAPRPAVALPWRGLASALLVLAVALMVAEGVLAGRGPDGFWDRRGLGAPGAAGRRNRRSAALHATAVSAALLAVASAPLLLPTDASRVVVVADDAGWDGPDDVAVPLRDSAGAVDLERALAEAAARVDPLLGLDVVVAAPVRATRGDTMRGAAGLLGREATLHVFGPTEPADTRDVVAADLVFSGARFVGDALDVTGLLYAVRETPATVRILLDDEVVEERDLTLPSGWTSLPAVAELRRPGTATLRLEVTAEGDEVPGNDVLVAVLEVRNGPRVAVYSHDHSRANAFANALAAPGMQVEVRLPHTLGARVAAFEGLDAVVLMDVAAIDLVSSQQDALEAWVRDHGGALALLGGERAFGPGGYLETPLDALSPLSSKVSRDAPAVAMLFVLDRSGSMQQVVDGRSRLDIAKEATLAATDLLGEGSEVAVVVFDEEARVLLPFTQTSDRSRIVRALAPLTPGGGTALDPGLELAAHVLAASDAATKHVVVMTDGLSRPGDVEGAVQRLVDLGATVSAIAIGSGADVDKVRSIARVGGGAAHTTTDFRALPSILAQEAMLLAGDPVVRETVVPRRVSDAPDLMEGTPEAFPPLTGFVETTAKAAAQVLVADDQDRPLLAAWRYGAGRVLAFGSEGVGPWSAAWSQHEAFADWWARWLRWAVQPSRRVGLDLQATVTGDDLRVDVLASHPGGEPLTGLSLTATASREDTDDPLGPARLAEVAPGQYRGYLRAAPGTWTVRVSDAAGGDAETASATVALSYLATLGAPAGEDPVLVGLVGLTGGQRLGSASDLVPRREAVWLTTRAWRPWLLAGLAAWTLFLVHRYAPGWLSPASPRRSRRPAAGA